MDDENDVARATQIAMQMANKCLFRGDDDAVLLRRDGGKFASFVAATYDDSIIFEMAKAGNLTAYRAMQILAATYANYEPHAAMPIAVRTFLAWAINNDPPAKTGQSAKKFDRNFNAAAVFNTVKFIEKETKLARFGMSTTHGNHNSITAIVADAFGQSEDWVRKALTLANKEN